MIKTKQDLNDFLASERKNISILKYPFWKRIKKQLFTNPAGDEYYIWKYIKTLRKSEYYVTKRNKCYFLLKVWNLYKLRKYGRITGFQLPLFVFEKGLNIYHWGNIIVNGNAKIGENCTIYADVLIGHKSPGKPCPRIGNNCFICSGAKIIGDISIGDNVVIAHNTVVFKDVPSNCIIAGNPAKIIKKDGEKCCIPL